MRALTAKQKKLLDVWYVEKDIQNEPGIAVRDVVQELLPDDLWEELQAINDTEVLYQNVNNYINEKS